MAGVCGQPADLEGLGDDKKEVKERPMEKTEI